MYKPTLKERYSYLRYNTNWHKHPWLSAIMCWFGRHDYEARFIAEDSAMLECFYCLHRKNSFAPNKGTRIH